MTPPVLAANLKWLFSEWPIADRFAAAAACGFAHVELSLPYELPIARLQSLLRQHRLHFVYLLAAVGDWDAGERGLAALPGRERDFRDGVRLALEYAAALAGPVVHVGAGNCPDGADRLECERLLRDNLRWAARAASEHGLRLVVEPICRRDYPRFMVNTVADGLALIRDVGADNLGLVLDLHQVQWEEGFSADRVHAAMDLARPRLWHMQLALAPDRNGPGDTGYDIHATLAHARHIGYAGVFSCEYRPAAGTLASLGWAERYGIRAATLVPGALHESA